MPESARLVATAAYGLAGSRTDLPARPLTDVEWFDLVQGCMATDLVGFLAAAVAGGHLPVTPSQADGLAVLEAERAGLSLLVERRAVTAASLLAAAGIDHRIVDGPARRSAYGDVAVRQFACVQVLVPPGRLGDAVALQGPPPLGADGRAVLRRERLALRSTLPGLGVAAGAAAGGDATESRTGPDPDLTERLGPAAVLDIGGREVPVLTLEQQLVVACAEVVASPVSSLALLRDVAQLALSPRLEATRARRLAETNQVGRALAEGVALAWSSFDLADKTELSVWALRMGGVRRRRPGARSAPPAVRHGLAQRVFGRLQPGPAAAGAPAGPPSMTEVAPTASARSNRSTRR